MKLVLQDGCFDRSLSVNDKPAEEIDSKILVDIFISLLHPYTEVQRNLLIQAISDAIENSDDSVYEDLGSCEQCSSYSAKWEREISI